MAGVKKEKKKKEENEEDVEKEKGVNKTNGIQIPPNVCERGQYRIHTKTGRMTRKRLKYNIHQITKKEKIKMLELTIVEAEAIIKNKDTDRRQRRMKCI